MVIVGCSLTMMFTIYVKFEWREILLTWFYNWFNQCKYTVHVCVVYLLTLYNMLYSIQNGKPIFDLRVYFQYLTPEIWYKENIQHKLDTSFDRNDNVYSHKMN